VREREGGGERERANGRKIQGKRATWPNTVGALPLCLQDCVTIRYKDESYTRACARGWVERQCGVPQAQKHKDAPGEGHSQALHQLGRGESSHFASCCCEGFTLLIVSTQRF